MDPSRTEKKIWKVTLRRSPLRRAPRPPLRRASSSWRATRARRSTRGPQATPRTCPTIPPKEATRCSRSDGRSCVGRLERARLTEKVPCGRATGSHSCGERVEPGSRPVGKKIAAYEEPIPWVATRAVRATVWVRENADVIHQRILRERPGDGLGLGAEERARHLEFLRERGEGQG